MAQKILRSRAKSDGKASPCIDDVLVNNQLLLDLPEKECATLYSQLTFLPLRTRDILHEPGEPVKFAYFVNSGLVSILSVMHDGKSVEVGLTGKEGFVGLPLVADFTSSPTRAVVQIEGSAFRISAQNLRLALRQCRQLERKAQRYVQDLAMQGTQVAACNRLHEVDERLARWLLMCRDRIGSDFVPLTQEFLAHMLGTRRSSVTVAAGNLHKAGLIAYNRGHVQIKNHAGLLDAACECYQAMQRQKENWDSESQA